MSLGKAQSIHKIVSKRGTQYALPWKWLVFITGASIIIVYWHWTASSLNTRLIRDVFLFIGIPGGIAISQGKQIGWRFDRSVLRNSLVLFLFVLPFYIIGASLPTIRAYYPMWTTTTALTEFVPNAVALFILAAATETYFRGFLCVGLREIGAKCIFISPIVYAVIHSTKPPVELLLSGPTDVLFGSVDYYSNSIVPSIIAHGGGLVLLDWLVLIDPLIPPETTLNWLSWLPVPL